MKIIFFTHPSFMNSTSMPRYAKMLQYGMQKRGHHTEIWTAKPFLYNLPVKPLKKWFGYIDQFIIFPIQVKLKLLHVNKNVLFVFTDHALGPWVPLVRKRKHIIHCHDFIAQKSALGELEENIVGLTGKWYQAFIRRGYRKGKNFISISKETQKNLHIFLGRIPEVSEVIYNGLNQSFSNKKDLHSLLIKLSGQLNIDLMQGYILHVGGNQFYKNRKGVLELYNAWSINNEKKIPLLMVGKKPTMDLLQLKEALLFRDQIFFLENIQDDLLKKLYQGATVFLFPSLYEGFGWPIAEAMASGCPVITTNEQPMNEVAGEAGFYIKKMSLDKVLFNKWLSNSVKVLNKVIQLMPKERDKVVQKSVKQVEKFDTDKSLDLIEDLYKSIKK